MDKFTEETIDGILDVIETHNKAIEGVLVRLRKLEEGVPQTTRNYVLHRNDALLERIEALEEAMQ